MIDVVPVLLGSALIGAATPQPIRLEVRALGDKRVIEVIGESAVPCTATYRLEVAESPGGNSSTTSGGGTIKPGSRQTLASVTIGGQAASQVTAKLEVQPSGGAPYHQVWP